MMVGYCCMFLVRYSTTLLIFKDLRREPRDCGEYTLSELWEGSMLESKAHSRNQRSLAMRVTTTNTRNSTRISHLFPLRTYNGSTGKDVQCSV